MHFFYEFIHRIRKHPQSTRHAISKHDGTTTNCKWSIPLDHLSYMIKYSYNCYLNSYLSSLFKTTRRQLENKWETKLRYVIGIFCLLSSFLSKKKKTLQSFSRGQRGNCCNFLLTCADDAIIASLRVTAVSAKQCQTMLLLDWIVFYIWLYGVAISSTNVATRNHVSRYIMLENSFNFPFVRYVDIRVSRKMPESK